MVIIIVTTAMFGCFGVWMWIVSKNLKEAHDKVVMELQKDNLRMKISMEASRKQRRANSILFGRLADSFSECLTDKNKARELREMAAQVEIMAIKEQMRYHTTPELKKALKEAKQKTIIAEPHIFEEIK
jgi:hypothetical protein